MKKIILFLFMAISIAITASADPVPVPKETHEIEDPNNDYGPDRSPINLPIKILYDAATNIVEVWCDDDNISGEVFIYNEAGALEEYSAYMNVEIELTNKGGHCIIIRGDYWESIGYF